MARESVIDVRAEVVQAQRRIRRHIRETPLECSLRLGERADCDATVVLGDFIGGKASGPGRNYQIALADLARGKRQGGGIA